MWKHHIVFFPSSWRIVWIKENILNERRTIRKARQKIRETLSSLTEQRTGKTMSCPSLLPWPHFLQIHQVPKEGILPGETWTVSKVTTELWEQQSRAWGPRLCSPQSCWWGQVNNWLQNWCWWKCFGFCDRGTLFTDQHLRERDEIHLTKRGKAIFTNRMAYLKRKGLNEEWWGRERVNSSHVGCDGLHKGRGVMWQEETTKSTKWGLSKDNSSTCM